MRLIARIVLTALAFLWVLPFINGFDFHGNFLQAVFIAIIFGLMLWLVDVAAVALSAIVTVGTMGVALLWLIPLWILGFWLLPAVALKVVSDLWPQYLSIHGWLPAILGGLFLMLIGTVTSHVIDRRSRAY